MQCSAKMHHLNYYADNMTCVSNLFRNVECSAVCFLMSPVTSEYFTKYWIIRLLETL